jgi:hypothetical protein
MRAGGYSNASRLAADDGRWRNAETARHKLITKRYKRVGTMAYALLDVTLQYRFWRLAISPLPKRYRLQELPE